MDKKKFLKKAGVAFLIAFIVIVIYEIVTLVLRYFKYKDDLQKEAGSIFLKKKRERAREFENTLESNIESFEDAMLKKGAVLRGDLNKKNREKFGERCTYEYNGNFYRIGTLVFEEGENPYIVINAIDNEKYANLGIMEEIEAYPHDIPKERICEVVDEVLETEL